MRNSCTTDFIPVPLAIVAGAPWNLRDSAAGYSMGTRDQGLPHFLILYSLYTWPRARDLLVDM